MSGSSRGHILVVEDEPALRAALAETLVDAGFSVDTAKDGAEALFQVGVTEPDVVVADIEMPGMNGYELCRRLRASGHDAIPFVFLSGLGSTESRVEGLEAGADDFMVKPVAGQELILKLARQVDRVRKLRAAASAAGMPAVNAEVLAEVEARLAGGTGVVRLGRFELRTILGHGAMGTVFKAWDTKLERWVAIKTVRAGAGMAEFWDVDLVRSLVAEAAMVARFNHPHVVAVHDVHDAADAAYVVMEFVDGVSLEDLLQRGALESARTAPLLAAVASALAAAHAIGMLHRDVKPGNVLIGRDGAIKLGDFGIAAFVSAHMRGSVFGTPGYVAPEALRGQGFLPAADLFSLGAIAYRCLAGRPAFGGATSAAVLTSTLAGRVTPLGETCPSAPAELQAIVDRLLESNPVRRIADAAALSNELARMCELRGWRWTAPDLGAPGDEAGAAAGAQAPHGQVLHTRAVTRAADPEA
jgi:CheY-like chemotaxis protein